MFIITNLGIRTVLFLFLLLLFIREVIDILPYLMSSHLIFNAHPCMHIVAIKQHVCSMLHHPHAYGLSYRILT